MRESYRGYQTFLHLHYFFEKSSAILSAYPLVSRDLKTENIELPNPCVYDLLAVLQFTLIVLPAIVFIGSFIRPTSINRHQLHNLQPLFSNAELLLESNEGCHW